MTGLRVLARGEYATVYAAVQESVGRDVAVKVENRRLETERDQRRFLREARAAGRMSSHPHVVDLFDAGVTADDHPYLIMELCDGSYAERMRSAPLQPAEARDVGVKIADALSDAHTLGVLHRDVKPANILHSGFGEPTLADFGLAILAEVRDTSITFDVLTPAYAAPETFRHAVPGPPGDVYALAATLYALMHGRPPRWPVAGTPSLVSVMEMFQQRIPELPGVPPAFTALLRAGMANDHACRPTALELRDALDALGLDGSAAASSVTRPAARRPATVLASSPGRAAGALPAPGEDALVASGEDALPAPGEDALVASGEDVTVRHDVARRAARRRWWWPLGAVVVSIATLSVLMGGHAFGGLLPRTSAAPTAPVIASAPTAPVIASAPTAPVIASAPAAPCSRFLPAGARCPGGQECYGDLSDTGAAHRVECAGPHTWEVFALGDLPTGPQPTDYRSVRANPAVQAVCNQYGLVTLVPLADLTTWKIDVLPPTGENHRTYRCLAGKGPNQLTAPALGTAG